MVDLHNVNNILVLWDDNFHNILCLNIIKLWKNINNKIVDRCFNFNVIEKKLVSHILFTPGYE